MSKSADKILKTAENLFNKHSFVAVGVDLIRDESGCSKTTMYTYFKNKQHLVYEVLKKRDQRFRSSLVEATANKNGMDALDAIYDWHIQWFQSDYFKGCLFVRAVGESSPAENEIHQLSQNHKTWLYDFIYAKAKKLEQAKEITELFHTQIEGLISRFMVEKFNKDVAMKQKKMIFQLINFLQINTEQIP
ncbi:TetR family transcriptional regulator [Acinetobacter sp. Ac_877]|uniref:TetR/AcrR family transcriptional regulator n=1 Tax=Acinetobacter portensis TaxID=1839785 RepID=UPI00128E828C|nr:TetR/AcrR family transcriptional regulator [Acinetobacter portensis]MPW42526.1 TetR family transcriptional regulator [Acinetobacter portensis]